MTGSTSVDSPSQLRFFYSGLLAVLLTGYLTHFRGYEIPDQLFWDENYHVVSAEKYLAGVFFMEPHPPLGKLVIAAGQRLIFPDTFHPELVDTDFLERPPPELSLAGYRFFPALFSWLNGAILYLILAEITASAGASLLFSLPYLLDNAIIVHGRGAMLEGPQLFFVLIAIYLFVNLLSIHISRHGVEPLLSLLLGAAIGLACATKMNSLILAPLPLVSAIARPSGGSVVIREAIARLALASLGAICSIAAVWQIHFSLTARVNPKLRDSGFYGASAEYRERLASGRGAELAHFADTLGEHLAFADRYTRGVPALDLCKQDEKGSYPLFWPIGGSAINYRWERSGSQVSYLYLQSNPAAWAWALGAVVVSAAFCLCGSLGSRDCAPPLVARVFVALYAGYLATVLLVERVLYLYHYFIPLMLSYLLLPYAASLCGLRDRRRAGLAAGALFAASIVACYLYFYPLTYYEPLSDGELSGRAWLPAWRLDCAECQRTPFLASACPAR